MFPLHVNQDGSFQELAHDNDVKFGQLSVLTVNPKCKRGGHYHKRKEEWFYCLHGICEMEITNVQTEAQRVVRLDGRHRESIFIKPFESHTVINDWNEICELLVIISEPFNPQDMDTYQYGGVS